MLLLSVKQVNSTLDPAVALLNSPAHERDTLSTITKLARAAACCSRSASSHRQHPCGRRAFSGTMHWIAHLAAYALIAFAFSLGWPLRPAAYMVALVATIGAIHELTEIVTTATSGNRRRHRQHLGALIGVAIQRPCKAS